MVAVKALFTVTLIGSFLVGSGALAAPPVLPGQPPALVPPNAAATQDDSLPAGTPLNPYVPPACTGVFTDVACPGGFAVNWIEKFYSDGITAGCGTNPLRYCPDSSVTRAQMAVFVEKAMRGTSVWSLGDLGGSNTGLGQNALLNNVNAHALYDTAVGAGALQAQSYDSGGLYDAGNTAVGYQALTAVQPNGTGGGVGNTAVGELALGQDLQGRYNTAVGDVAGDLWTNEGSYNTFIGWHADSQVCCLTDAIGLGAQAWPDASYHTKIGDDSQTQIGGHVAWSNLSDARAKNDIRDLDLGLDFVLALHPVAFTMKRGNGRTDMGFIAQDVEALLGDGYNVLGIGGDRDRMLSLRYTDFIAPMVKAIQEQQATIAAQQANIEAQQLKIASQQTDTATLKAEVEALLARVTALEKAPRP